MNDICQARPLCNNLIQFRTRNGGTDPLVHYLLPSRTKKEKLWRIGKNCVALNKKGGVVCECDKNRGIRVGLSTWSPICPTQPNLSYNPNDPIRRLVSFLETPPPPLSLRATPHHSLTNYGHPHLTSLKLQTQSLPN